MRRLPVVLLVLPTLLAAAAPLAAQQPQATRPEFISSNPELPFSQAVRVGNTIYLSGMLGTDGNALVPGGIQPETRRTLENIRGVLEGLGANLADIVKCTVFLADVAEWAAMNEAYVTFFPGHRPARSAVGVGRLLLDARVEIECVAVTQR